MPRRLVSSIVFPAPGQVVLETTDPQPIGPTDVRVRTWYTLMSTGTETIALTGSFSPGTHWARYVRYPFHPGYASVGEIVEVGADVPALAIGERVALRGPHASETVIAAERCYPIPDGLSSEQATWFALASIAFRGAQAAEYRIGCRVAIVGAGPIGQMSVRWASVAGAHSIVVVDPFAGRLKLAVRGGATEVLTGTLADCRAAIRSGPGGGAPDMVVDTTGHPSVLATALTVVATFGRVVILGDTGTPRRQAITGDVISRGLTIRGAHDSHELYGWSPGDIATLFFDLVSNERFELAGLNSHTFRPAECSLAYATVLEHRGDTMGVTFDWTGN